MTVLSACSKNSSYELHCSNTEICITNVGTANIPYSWYPGVVTSGYYGDTLLPGETSCYHYGSLNISYQKTLNHETADISGTDTAHFYTPGADHIYELDSCQNYANVVN